MKIAVRIDGLSDRIGRELAARAEKDAIRAARRRRQAAANTPKSEMAVETEG